MGNAITLRGAEATVTWSYHTAAVCRSWQATKAGQGRWALVASLTRADPFKLRQAPLLFNVPRKGGYWSWRVETITHCDAQQLRATLGPMEA